MTTFDPLSDSKPRSAIGYWWKCEGKKTMDVLFATTDSLRNDQHHIQGRYMRAIQLYENVDCTDLDAWRFMTDQGVDGPYQSNVIESIIDTIHSEIISNKTKCQFITFDGNYIQQQKAKDLTTFIAGVFRENKVNSDLAPSISLDALVFGDGWVKVYIDPDAGRVRAYRVFPWNIIVDDVEAANSPPLCMYESTLVSRELMLQYYEDDKAAQAIIKSETEYQFKLRQVHSIADMIEVREGWYIGTEKNPGRHVIGLRHGMLLDEEYTKSYFPFINLKYKKRPKGFLGKGIPEILEGAQERINQIAERIDAQIMANAPFIWAPPNSGIKESHLSNEIFRFIESEVPPQIINTTSVPPDLLQREAQLVQDAAGKIGVNALMMHSEVPAGLSGGSGKQLRIYNDTKSKRFMVFADQYEQFHINLAEIMIDMVHDHVDQIGESYKIRSENGGSLEELDFKDIVLPRDQFVIRSYPINFLSETPASRMADVQLLAEIAPEEMKPYIFGLLQNPDIEKVTSMLTAQQNSVNRILNNLMRKDDVTPNDMPPVPFMDLNLAIRLAQTYYVDSMSRGAPPEKIQKIIDWIVLAQEELKKMNTPALPNIQPQQQQIQQLPEQDIGVQLPGQQPQGPAGPVLQ